jgi:hypothetical protein
MRNRVRQSRTLGSVRGGDGAAMVTLHGHEAGNGGHSQGDTYGSDRSSPTRRRADPHHYGFGLRARMLA